ncbi:MAG: transcription antitermination factor NusB [Enterobacteriaceae bacterium]
MKPSTRRRARECAVQALYCWQISNNSIQDIEQQFIADEHLQGADTTYFHQLFAGVTANVDELDELMSPCLSRKLDELGQVEKAILRLALYELSRRQDVPYKVAINEAIELAKIFGAEESHKFINGVLDKVAPQVRKK